MDKKNIFEGIKFGDKEKQVVLNHSTDYWVGIEYEFNVEEQEEKTIHDLVDLDQDPDDVIRDMDKIAEDNSIYLDSDYASFMTEYLESRYEVEDYVPSVLMDLHYFIRKLSENITDSEPEDTETEDMFQQEKKDAYFKLYRDIYMKEVEAGEISGDNFFEFFNSEYLSSQRFYGVCKVLDVYYKGELFKGDTNAMEDFYKFYAINVQMDESFFDPSNSEENIRELETIDKINDQIEKAISQIRKSSLKDEFLKDDEVAYSVSEDGFSEGDFNIGEYIDYVEDYGNIPDVTDYIIDTFTDYVNSGYFEPENDSIDEDELRSQVSFIDHIEEEHNEMVEVITEKMTVEDAIENMQDMFKYMHNARVEDYAGMHISISTDVYDLDDFNLAKFITIMDIDHIRDYFPDRGHVENLQEIIDDIIRSNILKVMLRNVKKKEKSLVSIIRDMEYGISNNIDSKKYQTINFGDYKILDGRIELRFFGGENYHKQYEKIMTHFLRALYLLNFAYTDEHNKEYYKKITKMINNALKDEFSYSFSYMYSSLLKISEKIDIMQFLNDVQLGDHEPEDFDLFKRYFGKNTVEMINKLYMAVNY